MNAYCKDNTHEIKLTNNQYDLSSLKAFDITKATNWTNATIKGTTLTVSDPTIKVTYTYDLGNGETEVFTLIPKLDIITTSPVVTTTHSATTTLTATTTKTTTKDSTVTTATTTTVPVTTTTSTTQPTDILLGDANCDGRVDIADVVIIKCYLINSKDYSITKQGLINADVNESGNGINIQDSLAILKYALKLITTL